MKLQLIHHKNPLQNLTGYYQDMTVQRAMLLLKYNYDNYLFWTRPLWQSHAWGGVQTYFRPVLCCISPLVQGRLSWVMMMGDPRGSSHSAPVITHLCGLAFISLCSNQISREHPLSVWHWKWWMELFSCKNTVEELKLLKRGECCRDRVCLECCTWIGAPHNSAFLASHSRQGYLCYCLCTVGSTKWYLKWFFAEPEYLSYQGHNKPAAPSTAQVPMPVHQRLLSKAAFCL